MYKRGLVKIKLVDKTGILIKIQLSRSFICMTGFHEEISSDVLNWLILKVIRDKYFL